MAGLDIRHAANAKEREAVRDLRSLHGHGGLYASGLDEWDDGATLLIASDGARTVGSLRILDGPWPEPPVVTYFRQNAGSALLLPPGRRYVEIGKLVVAPDQRHFGVTAALVAVALGEVGRSGADGVLIACFDPLVPYYRRMGFRSLVHGDAPRPGSNLLALDDVGFPRLTAVKALVAALACAPSTSPLA